MSSLTRGLKSNLPVKKTIDVHLNNSSIVYEDKREDNKGGNFSSLERDDGGEQNRSFQPAVTAKISTLMQKTFVPVKKKRPFVSKSSMGVSYNPPVMSKYKSNIPSHVVGTKTKPKQTTSSSLV